MLSYKHLLIAAASTAALFALGACGKATSGTPAPAGVAIAAAAQQEAGQKPKSAVSLNAEQIEGLGRVLTDKDGMTLYRFDKDSADPPTSNCDAACVPDWPPVVADGDVVVAGVDKSLVDSIPRGDGDRQVTVGGWPVYRFAGDEKPGDAKGHLVDGVWHAATPEGGRAAGQARVAIEGTELPGFGAALTDQDGFTLYLFTEDSNDPSKSTCNGQCAANWPPVLVADTEPELLGVDPAIVGEVTREDGTRQVTVGGWPVYRFAKDTAPGQTNGHGVDGTWFVIEPAGCKSEAPVREQPEAEPLTGTGN